MGKSVVRPGTIAEWGRGKSVLDIIIGVVAAIILTLLGTLLYALILRLFHASESSIPIFALCIKALAAIAGGILAARRHSQKGWMRGAACGLLFILMAHLVFMIGGEGFVGGWALVIDLVLGITAGALGGILGVNRKA